MPLPEGLLPDELAAELAQVSPEVPSYAPVSPTVDLASLLPPKPDRPGSQAIGDLFRDYDSEGSLGGTFAPAFIKGYQPSERAVANWVANNRGVTRNTIEQTRMPSEYRGERVTNNAGVYGPPLDLNLNLNKGMVDPLALTAMAQGGRYDLEARRKAIAARLMANQLAQGG